MNMDKTDPQGRYVAKFGRNGEVIRVYHHVVEVWDWIPAAMEIEDMDERERMHEEEQKCLYLVGSLSGVTGVIEDVEPILMDQNTNTYVMVLQIKHKNETLFQIKKFGQFFEGDEVDRPLILPPFVYGASPYTVKTSDKFVSIATNEGSLTIFEQGNGQPSARSYDVLVMNGKVLFDIQGRCLSYVPQNAPDSLLTSLIIPMRNHSIYSKILQNLSVTAIDGFSKLTELQSMKDALRDKNLSSNLKLYISNLISGFKHPQHVVIVDLITGKQLAHFTPPNGVQYISFSPFNSQLLTVTARGDQIYKWDLTRMPLEVSLVDIQTRGKTSSIVRDIHWKTDSIYTLVTESSGSIHCFGSRDATWIMPNMFTSKVSSNELELFALVGDEIYMFTPDGVCNAKYALPENPIAKSLLPDHIPVEPKEEIIERMETKDILQNKSRVPLAQVEIETCFIGQPIYERIRFAMLKSAVRFVGPIADEIDTTKVEFGKGCGEAVFVGEKDELANAMNSVLILEDD